MKPWRVFLIAVVVILGLAFVASLGSLGVIAGH